MRHPLILPACLAAALLLAAACAKKTIESEPYGGTPYSSPAGGGAAAGADQREGGRSGEVREEALAGGSAGALSAAAAAEKQAIEDEDIYFDFDSALLTDAAKESLREKARWLQANPRARAVIEGHCDDRGTNEYNLALGERRAVSARDFLVALGIAESRLSTVSYGEERPKVAGTSEQARTRNRRAHFALEI